MGVARGWEGGEWGVGIYGHRAPVLKAERVLEMGGGVAPTTLNARNAAALCAGSGSSHQF